MLDRYIWQINPQQEIAEKNPPPRHQTLIVYSSQRVKKRYRTNAIMSIEVRVSTNSPKPGVEEKDGLLKVKVKAKPIEGKANAEVVEMVAKHYGVKENQVKIVAGHQSKKKTIEIIR